MLIKTLPLQLDFLDDMDKPHRCSRHQHQGCGRRQALACETPATRIDLLKGVSI
jgi:hypothetical protein